MRQSQEYISDPLGEATGILKYVKTLRLSCSTRQFGISSENPYCGGTMVKGSGKT